MVELGLIENKLIEAGQNDLTPNEETMLRSYAGNLYESLWQGFQERVKKEGIEATEKQITQWLAEQGDTLDIVYQEALIAVRNDRILELVCPDVTVTPEETEQYYRETFLEPDREAYEHDIPRYEREILNTGNESFFIPEGYRVIRQILLPFPQEILNRINALQPALEDGARELETAYNAVAEAGISGGDVNGARSDYKRKEDAYAALLRQVVEIEEEALPLVRETTDEIIRRAKAGEAFDSLIKEYAQQAGEEAGAELLFHADSDQWAETFKQHVLELTVPGEITEPFVINLGIHLVQYQEDYPGGEHTLTEEERQTLEASSLQAKKTGILKGMMEEWKKKYSIETFPELLIP